MKKHGYKKIALLSLVRFYGTHIKQFIHYIKLLTSL